MRLLKIVAIPTIISLLISSSTAAGTRAKIRTQSKLRKAALKLAQVEEQAAEPCGNDKYDPDHFNDLWSSDEQTHLKEEGVYQKYVEGNDDTLGSAEVFAFAGGDEVRSESANVVL